MAAPYRATSMLLLFAALCCLARGTHHLEDDVAKTLEQVQEVVTRAREAKDTIFEANSDLTGQTHATLLASKIAKLNTLEANLGSMTREMERLEGLTQDPEIRAKFEDWARTLSEWRESLIDSKGEYDEYIMHLGVVLEANKLDTNFAEASRSIDRCMQTATTHGPDVKDLASVAEKVENDKKALETGLVTMKSLQEKATASEESLPEPPKIIISFGDVADGLRQLKESIEQLGQRVADIKPQDDGTGDAAARSSGMTTPEETSAAINEACASATKSEWAAALCTMLESGVTTLDDAVWCKFHSGWLVPCAGESAPMETTPSNEDLVAALAPLRDGVKAAVTDLYNKAASIRALASARDVAVGELQPLQAEFDRMKASTTELVGRAEAEVSAAVERSNADLDGYYNVLNGYHDTLKELHDTFNPFRNILNDMADRMVDLVDRAKSAQELKDCHLEELRTPVLITEEASLDDVDGASPDVRQDEAQVRSWWDRFSAIGAHIIQTGKAVLNRAFGYGQETGGQPVLEQEMVDMSKQNLRSESPTRRVKKSYSVEECCDAQAMLERKRGTKEEMDKARSLINRCPQISVLDKCAGRDARRPFG